MPSSCAAEDNPVMKAERDLLPWILGGLSAVAIAVAYAAVSIHRDAAISPPSLVAAALPAHAQPAVAVQLPASPVPTALPTAAPTDGPNAAPVSVPSQTQTAEQSEAPASHIWQCTTNGVKTFSNNPCGDKSTLLDVGPINTMRPTPAIDYARAYGSRPRYGAAYPDQSAATDVDDYSDQYTADTDGYAYTIVGVLPRRRPVQYHRPPVKPAPPSHHSPAPVRRY